MGSIVDAENCEGYFKVMNLGGWGSLRSFRDSIELVLISKEL